MHNKNLDERECSHADKNSIGCCVLSEISQQKKKLIEYPCMHVLIQDVHIMIQTASLHQNDIGA